MKMRSLLASCVGLTLAASGVVFAGGQQIQVEVAPGAGSLLVRTYHCGTPSEIVVNGTAEGIVAGQEKSIALKLTRTKEPGVFAVERQWPAEGAWVLTFTTQGGAFVNALVELKPGPTLRIASQESTISKLSRRQVSAALQRVTGS